MDYDKIDEAVLALLYLNMHDYDPPDYARAWKSFDWDAMDRLHQKGLISNPVSKTKSVVFTAEGLRQSKAAFDRLFDAES